MNLIKAALLAVLFAAASVSGALAQAGLTYVPLGYCQLTSLGSSTALATCNSNVGIPAGSTRAVISAEAQIVRYRDDGTAPTSSVGMPIAAAGAPFVYTGTLSKLRFIEATSGGKINVLFYR